MSETHIPIFTMTLTTALGAQICITTCVTTALTAQKDNLGYRGDFQVFPPKWGEEITLTIKSSIRNHYIFTKCIVKVLAFQNQD